MKLPEDVVPLCTATPVVFERVCRCVGQQIWHPQDLKLMLNVPTAACMNSASLRAVQHMWHTLRPYSWGSGLPPSDTHNEAPKPHSVQRSLFFSVRVLRAQVPP